LFMIPTAIRKQPAAKHILIAEDEPMVADTFRLILTVDGHSVEVAEDGRQALAMFESGKHDLIITDFRMPNMDGLELAEEIKKRSPATPVILVTAHIAAIRAIGGRVSNVDVVLGKPCSVLELRTALVKVFSVGG
jgi:CheY-like chemotaxis protein